MVVQSESNWKKNENDLKEKFDDMLEDINYKYKTVINDLYNLTFKGKAAEGRLKYANDIPA